jgi:Amt family ammonium transporter
MVSETVAISTLMLSYGCMGVVTVLWSLIGYSMSFSSSTPTGVIGEDQLAAFRFGDQQRQVGWNADGTPMMSTVSEHAYAMFQLMFAIITPALISGAVVGKIK